MPEGPEVRRQSERMHAEMANQDLTEICVFDKKISSDAVSRLRKVIAHVHRHPEKRLFVEKVRNKGKYMYLQLRLQEPGSSGVKFIGCHMGMQGWWETTRNEYTRVSITVGGKVWYFNDRIRLGKFEVLTVSEMRDHLASLGPDVLSDAFTEQKFMRQIARAKRRSVAMALLDQSLFSGVGNYLRADIMYTCRLHPLKKISELSDEQLHELYHAIVKVSRNSYRDENYQTLVYQQTQDAKGNAVSTISLQGRTVYYVPNLQKL
jgi:DNA-formamidopyrimidine glycosylase